LTNEELIERSSRTEPKYTSCHHARSYAEQLAYPGGAADQTEPLSERQAQFD
jgi:hypothetical protein